LHGHDYKLFSRSAAVELKQLDYFVRVAELGGFTRAAVALALTQSAVSKQVRQLEIDLHQKLLLRNGRGIKLTEEGVRLLAHAKGILAQAERAEQELRDLKGSPTGKVIVGSSAAGGLAKVANLVTTFKSRFPRATLKIIELNGSSIHESLLLGRIDIGILYDPRPSPLIRITPLKKDELFLVSSAAKTALSRSAKVPFGELGAYPLILPSAVQAQLERWTAKAGIKLNVALNVDGRSFILELVNQALGYTVLPLHTVQESSLAPRLQVNSIVKPRLTRTLSLAVSTQRPATHLTQETIALILHILGPAPV
jgi:LysR family nitrogen assimilation transcriptional regulator